MEAVWRIHHEGDHGKLGHLISNAVKYTPAGVTVTVVVQELPCEQENSVKIQIEVRDTGIRMSKEFLPTLFDSFSRERNTTVGKVAGTGLGMAIVKKYVDLMGGSIDMKSELGKGTVFTLILTQKKADENYYRQKSEKQMPNMDGYKATKCIRYLQDIKKAEIPIIAMTANAFEEDRKKAFDAGMDGHIAKPIDIEKLRAVILSVLNKQDNKDEKNK